MKPLIKKLPLYVLSYSVNSPIKRSLRIIQNHTPAMKKAVSVILLAPGNRVFVNRRCGKNVDNFDNLVQVPGGSVDEGEDETEAAVREVREETGFSVQSHALRHISSRQHRTPSGMPYQTTTYVVELPSFAAPTHTEPHRGTPWEAADIFFLLRRPSSDFLPGLREALVTLARTRLMATGIH